MLKFPIRYTVFTLLSCLLLFTASRPVSALWRDAHDEHYLPPEFVFDPGSFWLGPLKGIAAAQEYLHLIPRPFEACGWICPVCGHIVDDEGMGWRSSGEKQSELNPITRNTDTYPLGHREAPEWLIDCQRGCDWDTPPGLTWCEGNCWYAFYFHALTSDFFPFFLDYLRFCAEVPGCRLLWPELGGTAGEINDLAYLAFRECDRKQLIWDFAWGWDEENPDTRAKYAVTYLFFYSHYHEIIAKACKHIDDQRDLCPNEVELDQCIEYLNRALDLIGPKFLSLYTTCLSKFSHPRLYYERMLVSRHLGKSLGALEDFKQLVDQVDPDSDRFISSQMWLEGGRLYNETLSFNEAIRSLTRSIQKDPDNREAYLERAYAYFETGDFASAVDDYRSGQPDLERIDPSFKDHFLFSKGLIEGALDGMAISVDEFVPSTLATLQGIGCGLWALACHPVDVSKSLVQASIACVDYLRSSTPKEVLYKLAPELRRLVEEWDTLSFEQRGHIVGCCIGKYGVDVFIGGMAIKGVKAAIQLKRANSLMTLQTCAASPGKAKTVTEAAARHARKRKEWLSSSNLRIHKGRQGKHQIGHPNYDPERARSILTHKNPERLVEAYAGKGQPIQGIPGKPGYKERIDFGEIIGEYFHREGGKKYPSSIGVICYSKDGVHVYPLRPVGFKQ